MLSTVDGHRLVQEHSQDEVVESSLFFLEVQFEQPALLLLFVFELQQVLGSLKQLVRLVVSLVDHDSQVLLEDVRLQAKQVDVEVLLRVPFQLRLDFVRARGVARAGVEVLFA